jgi:hypothetical protein
MTRTEASPRPTTLDPLLDAADRAAAAAGAAFVACILVGNSLTESVVGTDESPAGTVADLLAQGSSTAVRSGLVVELIGLMLLAVFAAGLAALGLRRGATPAGTLVAVTATLVVAVKLASAAPYLAALASVDELPDDVLHALVRTNEAAFVVGWLPFAFLVGAVALTLRQAGLAGRVLVGIGLVLAGLGVVAGAVGAVLPDNAVPIPFLLSLLWTAAVGIRLASRRR